MLQAQKYCSRAGHDPYIGLGLRESYGDIENWRAYINSNDRPDAGSTPDTDSTEVIINGAHFAARLKLAARQHKEPLSEAEYNSQCRKLNRARAVLVDPERRKVYNCTGYKSETEYICYQLARYETKICTTERPAVRVLLKTVRPLVYIALGLTFTITLPYMLGACICRAISGYYRSPDCDSYWPHPGAIFGSVGLLINGTALLLFAPFLLLQAVCEEFPQDGRSAKLSSTEHIDFLDERDRERKNAEKLGPGAAETLADFDRMARGRVSLGCRVDAEPLSTINVSGADQAAVAEMALKV
jgi:hypothetical protein